MSMTNQPLPNIESAEAHLHYAGCLDDLAQQARETDDHSTAGRYRERERAALKRAEIKAMLAQAEALESIADSLSRIALTL